MKKKKKSIKFKFVSSKSFDLQIQLPLVFSLKLFSPISLYFLLININSILVKHFFWVERLALIWIWEIMVWVVVFKSAVPTFIENWNLFSYRCLGNSTCSTVSLPLYLSITRFLSDSYLFEYPIHLLLI